ncbi:Cyclic di-GMP phosphodiesterase response regulator RpfG [Stieleria maiorica]|uniref:Cyclic di-GMP phosphodiesterase response regulator RpfG n=1 Tax=Stieleria maiorica TaxID=2795974 RepID=A0A5B9M840_9BACT|nr:HD-GYP domain-containing protein [Stieleria maiorica]QEF96833.1 Cyclic di-GMP phosphodiesterase response regulator RpfG [Stieleria maiorica]
MSWSAGANGTIHETTDDGSTAAVKVCTYDQGTLDGSLAHILAEGIGLSVTVVEARQGGHPLVVQATADPHRVHTEITTGSSTVRQALALPAGGVAVWSAPTDQADRIGRHATTLLELEIARNESKQLLAEVDSLTNQVMQDFEELSLIRALASSLELPQTEEDTDEFVLASLMPLVSGVGAVSIAAILVDDSGTQKRSPLWTGSGLIPDPSIFELIDTHREELRLQPVVRNRNVGDGHCGVAGLDEYIVVECSSEGRLHGWVMACNRVKDDIDDVPWAQLGFTTVQASLMETATNQLAAQLNNIRLLRQKEELFTDVIRALVNAVEARDPYTCGHSERVASFARYLASKIGFTTAECERIYLTGLLHDVGKIAIPDGVLQKPNRLNDEERAIIETHTDSGWRILQELEALQDILPGVLYHHEHWNGEGYPDQLAGENIPIDGRILAVCDAFDAMTSDRPYRKGMSIDRATGILNEGAGTFWDPNLIQVFRRHIEEIDEIRINHQPRQPASRPAPVDGRPIIGQPGFVVPAETPQASPLAE